jgi:hypothetical protein
MYKWTKDGIRVFVVRELGKSEYLVRSVLVMPSIYDDEQDEAEELGELRIVEAVYDTAPTEILSKDIAMLQGTVVKLQQLHGEIKKQISQLESEYDKRKEKLSSIPELRQLENFIAGKITHYVLVSQYNSPYIMAFQDTKSEYADYDDRGLKKMRMLSLYGKATGELEWNLHRYSDGSGSEGYTVIPCCSLEEAQIVLQQEFDKRFALGPSERLFDDAIKCGVSIPDEYAERVHQLQLHVAKQEVAKRKEELLKAEAKVDGLQH